MNKEDYSFWTDYFAQLYRDASIPVAFLDGAFRIMWANDAAISLYPALSQPDGLFALLPSQMADELPGLQAAGEKQTLLFPIPMTDRHVVLVPLEPVVNPSGYLLHLQFGALPTGTALHPENTEKMLSAFSDQFRSPLSTIYATLSALRNDRLIKENPQFLEMLQTINENCYRMLRSSSNMNDFIRLQTQTMALKPAYINLTATLRQIAQAAGIVTGHIGIPIHFTAEQGDILLQCDQQRIMEALLQLVANSCRFTKAENRIDISVREVGGRAVVTVEDNGIGIPENLQPMVFEPYFSYDPSGRPFAGTGIGLTLFRHIIQLHGGTVALSSTPGKGTAVIFTLPIQSSDYMPLSDQTSAQDLLRDRYSPVHVMLADSCPVPLL